MTAAAATRASQPQPAPFPLPAGVRPDLPAHALRQHMGEMTPDEMRTARAAIRWANAVARDAMKVERCRDA